METIAELLAVLTSAGGSASVVDNRLALKVPRAAEAIGRKVLARRDEAIAFLGMTATDVMIEAYRAGLSLSVEHGRLVWKPADAPFAGLRHALLAHEAEIVVRLTTPFEYHPDMELTVIASTDPTAVGGRWIGNKWISPDEEHKPC